MKKIVTLFSALLLFCVVSVNAQLISSDFETWANGKPSGWFGSKTSIVVDSIAQDAVNFHGGANSLKLINQTTSHKRFTSQPVTIKKDTAYEISFWARGTGNIRTGLFDGISNGNGYMTYNAYINVNTTTWTHYSQTLTAVNDTNVAEFIFSVQSTGAANGHLQIDDVTIGTTVPPTIDTVSIYDIQFTTDTSGNSPIMGETIRTSGIVTGAYASGYWIQDAPGAWNGVYVYDLNNKPAIGDEVFMTAVVMEYNKLTELGTVTGYQLLSTGNQLPAAEIITASQVNTEAYEGVLVRLNGVKCTNVNAGYGAWVLTDASGSCKVDKLMTSYTPTLNRAYNIVAVNHFSFAEYKLEPRDTTNDIMNATGIENINAGFDIQITPNPVKDMVKISGSENISFIHVRNVNGQIIKEVKVNATEISLNLSDLLKGVYFIEVETNNQQKTAKKIILQ